MTLFIRLFGIIKILRFKGSSFSKHVCFLKELLQYMTLFIRLFGIIKILRFKGSSFSKHVCFLKELLRSAIFFPTLESS